MGVSKEENFDYESAFSDYEFGWALYTDGCRLRHNSKALGNTYCDEKIKDESVIGVYLNMDEGIRIGIYLLGILRFKINKKCFGVAYQDDLLKEGPIFPALAC